MQLCCKKKSPKNVTRSPSGGVSIATEPHFAKIISRGKGNEKRLLRTKAQQPSSHNAKKKTIVIPVIDV
jgi:hypothetical protein